MFHLSVYSVCHIMFDQLIGRDRGVGRGRGATCPPPPNIFESLVPPNIESIMVPPLPSPQSQNCSAVSDRPFAARGHMVQNPKYWRAKEFARLQNKTQLTRIVYYFFVYISQWSLVTLFGSAIFWILYHVTSSCKGSIARRI